MRTVNKKESLMQVELEVCGQKVTKKFKMKKFQKLIQSKTFVEAWKLGNPANMPQENEEVKLLDEENIKFFKEVFDMELTVGEVFTVGKFEIRRV
jgi:hypothetical protein